MIHIRQVTDSHGSPTGISLFAPELTRDSHDCPNHQFGRLSCCAPRFCRARAGAFRSAVVAAVLAGVVGDSVMGEQAKHEHFSSIQRAYKEMLPKIMMEPNGVDPYFMDWAPHFTPIERMAWNAIRSNGIPMYPQFPIGKFFADFADPHRKIAIECDGAAFHKTVGAAEYDRFRDRFMAGGGWVVYRITGRECWADDIDWEEIESLEHDGETDEANARIRSWLRHTSDGIIRAIAAKHYGKVFKRIPDYEVDAALRAHSKGAVA